MHVFNFPGARDEDAHQTSSGSKHDVAHVGDECEKILPFVKDKKKKNENN